MKETDANIIIDFDGITESLLGMAPFRMFYAG